MVKVQEFGGTPYVAIPAHIRKKIGIKKGDEVAVISENDTILIKKLSIMDFSKPPKPLNIPKAECNSA